MRFQVGELVLVTQCHAHYAPIAPGSVGFITDVNVDDLNGTHWDYGVDCPESESIFGFREAWLKRIDPPAEPEALTRKDEAYV